MVRKRRTPREKDLIRRYLLWCYKTTKEDLDRIDRYFTQFEVDTFLLKELRRGVPRHRGSHDGPYGDLLDQFVEYMQKKHQKALKKKFVDEKFLRLDPSYKYLQQRFLAIEKAVVHFLGKRELEIFRSRYEQEMTSRILAAREHS
jgi:hypothetical protein